MRNLAFVLLLSLCASASEVIHLKNGDRVTGAVEKVSDTKLVVKSALLGQVSVDLSQVERIDSDKNFTVVSAGRSYTAQSLRFNEENANLSLAETHAVSVSRQTLEQMYSDGYQPVPPAEPSMWSNWATAIDAGLSAARGTSSTTNLNLGFRATRASDRDRLNLGVTSLFAQNSTSGDTVTSANAIHAGTRYDLNVRENMFTFALANFDADKLQNLDLRSVLGGGAGVRLSQSEHTSFDLFGGASLNQELFSTEPTRRSGEFITGQELRLKPTSRTELSQRLMFFPNFTEAGEYRVALDSAAVLKLNSWLGWQAALTNTYLSNPAPGTRNNDLLVTTGIRVAFGEEHGFKPKLKVPAFAD